MQFRSNKIKDIREYYLQELKKLYPKQEATSLLDVLLEGLLNISRTSRAANPDHRLSESEILEVHFGVKELKKYRPVQYILNHAHFFGLDLYVDERVLIPRSETEELAETIVKSYHNYPPQKVLDIGTGSGCIALALKKSFPSARVWGLDVSIQALEVAKKNAASLGMDVRFISGDINKMSDLDELPDFDLIVSNPPYVKKSEKKNMQKNVLDHEPEQALFVDDNNPLLFYRKIAVFAKENLENNGRLFLEINERFGEDCTELLTEHGFSNVILRQDLFGKNRIVSAVQNR